MLNNQENIMTIKNQVVEIVSTIFRQLMGENFTQENLNLFLSRNEDIIEMMLMSNVSIVEILDMIFYK
jgi:hypothetical protein